MHGREDGRSSPVQGGSNRRLRTRLNVELGAELSENLRQVLKTENLTQRRWANAVVAASLGRRGFGAAGKRLFLDRIVRERQLLLRAGLYAVNRLHSEPLVLKPSEPIRDHIYAVVASARLKEIRDMLFEVLRQVASLKDWNSTPSTKQKARAGSDKSRGAQC